MHKVIVKPEEVKKIAHLANLRLQENEVELFSKQFTETIDVVSQLNEIDTSTVRATYQVTGLTNITREDVIDQSRILPQEVALREAELVHNGYFVVPRVIDTDS